MAGKRTWADLPAHLEEGEELSSASYSACEEGLPMEGMRFEDGRLKGNGFEVELTPEEQDTLKHYYGKEIVLGVRPEDIAEEGSLAVRVVNNENLGMNTLVHGMLGAESAHVVAKLRGWKNYRNGDTAGLRFGRKHFFDRDTTNAIRKEGK